MIIYLFYFSLWQKQKYDSDPILILKNNFYTWPQTLLDKFQIS